MTPPRKTNARKQSRKRRLVIGLMSGTSADGIDVALVRIARSITNGARARAQLENFVTLPFPAAVRAAVLRVAEGARVIPRRNQPAEFSSGSNFSRKPLCAPAANSA